MRSPVASLLELLARAHIPEPNAVVNRPTDKLPCIRRVELDATFARADTFSNASFDGNCSTPLPPPGLNTNAKCNHLRPLKQKVFAPVCAQMRWMPQSAAPAAKTSPARIQSSKPPRQSAPCPICSLHLHRHRGTFATRVLLRPIAAQKCGFNASRLQKQYLRQHACCRRTGQLRQAGCAGRPHRAPSDKRF
jgi:hypothetical protein